MGTLIVAGMCILAAVLQQGCSQIVLGREMRHSYMSCTALPHHIKAWWKVLRVSFIKVRAMLHPSVRRKATGKV